MHESDACKTLFTHRSGNDRRTAQRMVTRADMELFRRRTKNPQMEKSLSARLHACCGKSLLLNAQEQRGVGMAWSAKETFAVSNAKRVVTPLLCEATACTCTALDSLYEERSNTSKTRSP